MPAHNLHAQPQDTSSPTERENMPLPKLVERSIIMPNDSMKHVLKFAFNEIAALILTDQQTPPEFYQRLARAILETINSLDEE